MADSQRIQQLSAAPGSPVKGTIYFDTSLNALGVYNGTEWLYGSSTGWTGGGGGYTEIDGNLTLGGKAVAATPPTSGGPYGLVFNGTDWVSEAVFLAASGGPDLGYVLMEDASGNSYWANPGPDAVQPGFLAGGSPITATINSSTGVLTFSNWPASQKAWWATSETLIRGTVPATPTALTVSGVTSGDYAYLQVYATAPTTPQGPGSVGALVVGTSRTTAALAAADQIGAAAQLGQTLVWDGIAHLSGSTWSLVAGTPASGSIIPAATGRDRRPWALGGKGRAVATATKTTTSTSLVVIDATNLAVRIECSGNPVTVKFACGFQSNAQPTQGQLGFLLDGAVPDSISYAAPGGLTQFNNANSIQGLIMEWESIDIAAGSHLFEAAWANSSGDTITLEAAASNPAIFRVIEEIAPIASNGTA